MSPEFHHRLVCLNLKYTASHRLAAVLKQCFINVSCYIFVASLTLMALFKVLKTEPSDLDWLQIYDITHL